MGQKLSPEDIEFYKRADEVLFYLWDPIGVSKTPEARDEYYGYLSVVFSMFKQGKSPEEVASYLTQVERDRMGLSGASKQEEGNLEIAMLLEEHRCFVLEKFKQGGA